MTCCDASIGLEIAGAGNHSDELREKNIRNGSQRLENGILQTSFIIPDMHCAACIGTIERGLSKLPHVNNVRANLTNHTVAVTWNPSTGTGDDIACAIDRLGFTHSLYDSGIDESDLLAAKGRRLLLSIAVSGFAAANIMLLSIAVWSGANAETAQLFHLISGFIAIPAVAYAGQPFFRSALNVLAVRRLNMDVPISLAILLATGMSLFESLSGGSEAYFDAAVMLTFFLLIGRYLDHLMREKARGSVRRLARLSAKGAIHVQPDGTGKYVTPEDIVPDMILRVRPGEHFPVNGEVVAGLSEIDRSLVTGEADPVRCEKGSRVEAGVTNLTGSVDIRATSTSETSFLAEIRNLMEAAEKGRGKYVRIADRMAQIYAPAVHLLALATFIGWMVATKGDWHASIFTAVAVLIITCPCALGLAVPVAHVVGASRLLKDGILIRDGSAFERLAEIDTIIFDKTGTLTLGRPTVASTQNFQPEDATPIHTLASRSSHPAAKAIAAFLGELKHLEVDTEEASGFGIEAFWEGRKVRLGRPSWVMEIATKQDGACEQPGTLFAIEDCVPTSFVLKDELRPDAVDTINHLARSGLQLEILSGDNNSSVSDIAEQVGIGEYRSEMTPIEKIERIRKLQADGHKVLMVGDGLNDAPALAAADVSIAPASASDVGRFAADLVFTRPSLTSVSTAHLVAQSTSRLVKQNFAIALLYNSIAVPLAMIGMVTPLFAAIAMSTSSIAVVLNSMRLNLHRRPIAFSSKKTTVQGEPMVTGSYAGLSKSNLEVVT